MARSTPLRLLLAVPAAVCVLGQVPGDSASGRDVFRSAGCGSCHEPGSAALRPVREFSRASLAAALWNHLARLSPPPRLSQEQASDLFSYLWLERTLLFGAGSSRGRVLFRDKGCVECHRSVPGVRDPIRLAGEFWNHAARNGAAGRRVRLTPRDALDLAAAVAGQSGGDPAEALRYAPGPAARGEAVFGEKGCRTCHHFPPANRFPPRTHGDLLAALWNHARRGVTLPPLREEEAAALAGYLWSIHYFDERGDVLIGAETFDRKGCGRCHNEPASGVPDLDGRGGEWTPASIAASLLRHGAGMRRSMHGANFDWPEIRALEMADLIGYVNSLKGLRTRPWDAGGAGRN